MVPGPFGEMGEVIRVDSNAVPSHQTWREWHEVPLGSSGGEYVHRVKVEHVTNRGQLIHKSNIEIALRVLDNLGSLGDLDRWRPVDLGFHHRTVDRGDHIQSATILSCHDFPDRFKAMLLVAWINALWRIADREVVSGKQPRRHLENWGTVLLGSAGINSRFIYDNVAGTQRSANCFRCTHQRSKIGLMGIFNRCWHRNHIEVCFDKRLHVRTQHERRLSKIVASDLPSSIMARTQFRDSLLVDVEGDYRCARTCEPNGDR